MRASLISFLSIGMLLLSGVSLGNYDEPGDNDQDAEPIENKTRDFTGGDGSIEHPFQISTVSQLQDMRDNLSAHYELINDINASETKDWNGYLGFEPIGMDTDGATEGFQGDPFNGSLNGNNHTISGIHINRTSLNYVGLFGRIMDSGSYSTVVKYLDIKEAYVTGTKYVGILTGCSDGSSLINISVEGEIVGKDRVGGLIGKNWNSRLMSNCSSKVTMNISGADETLDHIGGLVGENYHSDIYFSTSSFLIYINNTDERLYHIGGFIGGNEKSTILNCSSIGNILIENISNNIYRIGGIIGTNVYGTSEIISSTISGLIKIDHVSEFGGYIGGLIGIDEGPGIVISNCSVSCPIIIENSNNIAYVGGIIGYNKNYCEMENSHSYGQINISNCSSLSNIGGLIGLNEQYSSVTDCKSNSPININQSPSVYAIGGLIGLNYYHSIATNCDSSGSISISNCLSTIENIGGLIGLNDYSSSVTDCHSSNPIDIHRSSSTIINIGGLIGYNLKSRNQDCVNSGPITITDIESPIENIGGLIGKDYGYISEISNCHSQGSLVIRNVPWFMRIGGLIGIYDGDRLSDCSSSGSIRIENISQESFAIGGLIGYCTQSLFYCGSSKRIEILNVSSNIRDIGGLIGDKNDGFLTDCYSEGSVIIDNVTGNVTSIGGLVGIHFRQSSSYCYSRETVSITNIDQDLISIGGLMGYNGGSLDNCHFSGTLGLQHVAKNVTNIGGLVGCNYLGCIVRNSVSHCEISIKDIGENIGDTGGFIGYNDDNCDIFDSSSNISISIENVEMDVIHIGGLIGENAPYSDITNCISTGLININDAANEVYRIGGLIGKNGDGIHITTCFASLSVNVKNVDALKECGGFIGSSSSSLSDSLILNSHCQCNLMIDNVRIIDKLGGFIGNNLRTSITNSYSALSLTGQAVSETDLGAFIGYNTGTVTNCFWEDHDELRLDDTNEGAYGKSTDMMKSKITFTVKNWDFENIWTIVEDITKPYLRSLYHQPRLLFDCPADAVEDIEYTLGYIIDISYTSIGNYVTNYSIDHVPDWMSVDHEKCIVSGTPENDDVGEYELVFNITDVVGETKPYPFHFKVINVNDAPWILTEIVDEMKNTLTDRIYVSYFFAIDIDPVNTTLNWTMTTDAEWLSFDSKYGMLQISGTPTEDDIGNFWVNISVTDNKEGFSFKNFTIDVGYSNLEPIIDFIPASTAYEDEIYMQTLVASDPDQEDVLSWSVPIKPDWLDLSGRNTLYGTPTNDDVGTYWIEVMVTDSRGAHSGLGFTLTVENTNDPPEWVDFPQDQNILEGTPIILEVSAGDVDEGDLLLYSISSSPSCNISIDWYSGAIKWLDTISGSYNIKVNVTDGNSSIERNFTILVEEIPPVPPPVNHGPIIVPINKTEVSAGQKMSIHLNATDEDGDILTFILVSGPSGVVLSHDGLLIWIPSKEDVGNHTVSYNVSDGKVSVMGNLSISVKSKEQIDDNETEPKENKEVSGITYVLYVSIGFLAIAIIVFFILIIKTGKRDKDYEE